ncbi:MAG: hypothetical protein US42_C0005G0043 [Candidatus Magasanikbacteria bacterium GW2011_GWC2_37_14]|uniref:Uncharacterized protein n=1 Tax=Candidatus Magasanikbacteria bacterium GW2011_GWC2_37_14 TaxID=1619046 RepID=A0A0G0G9P6_9BACT|nr:MAG: hypothetical protein US42_C0005G0043 [Candidatus Magasanikbacteria bacterium GW2011_GWC2_37_14]
MLLFMWLLNKLQSKHQQEKTYHSPEYQQFLKLRLINISVFTLLGLATILGCLFIYQNIFLTIGQAEEIIIAKSGLSSLEVIDFTKFEKVEKIWQEKIQTTTSTNFNDPFNNISSSTEKSL